VAFTTQQGTGGAPWTFQGTPEADTIAVITGDTQDTQAFDFIADGLEGDDVINWNGVRSVTIKGGQGADVITNNIAQSAALATLISNSFINGNDGNDVIGNTQIGLQATLSTVSGGQADDRIFIGSLQSSKVNGNRGDDFLEIGDQRFDENIVGDRNNYSNSSIFGGQGADVIEVVSADRAILGTVIDGQVGDDVIALSVGNALNDPSFRGSVAAGGDGNDLVDASGILVFSELDEVSFSDLTLEGNAGDDSVFGGAGEDVLTGESGQDWLSGYADRDTLVGGTEGDILIGAYFDGQLAEGFIGDGAGDTLTGGTGANLFFIPGVGSAFVSGFIVNDLGSTDFVQLDENPDDGLDNIISNGDILAVEDGADVITDWTASAGSNLLNTGLGDNLAAFPGGDPAMSLGFEYDDGTGFGSNYAVRGFYVERFNELGEFTVSAGGTDIAVWTNYTGDGFEFGEISNLTILQNVPTTVVLTANQFVADI
jgi:Ca2+-binding RTX toxin-like protein